MKVRMIGLALLVGLMSVVAVASATTVTAKRPDNPFRDISLSGSIVNPDGSTGGAFEGAFRITSFVVEGDQLYALGTLNGTLRPTDGKARRVRNESVKIPARLEQGGSADLTANQAACPILNLVLGPLNLNLLGLVVSIPNPVILNITAVPGPGNLLGNLLCAVAGLLDSTDLANLAAIANLLNAILALFG